MLVSVALCTYNGEQFLQKQLKSILDQTVRIDELIIGDDCSTDATISIINSFQSRYPGMITLHINEVNLGCRKNFEKAIALTTGDIIFLADQDDIWHADKVKETLKVFNSNEDAWAVFSDADLIYENDVKAEKTLLEVSGFSESGLDQDGYFYNIVMHGNMVAGSVLAFRRLLREVAMPFRMQDILWHDEWLALVAADENRLCFLNIKLVNYRLHANQQLGIGDNTLSAQHIRFREGNVVPDTKKEAVAYFQYCFKSFNRVFRLKESFPRVSEWQPQIQAELKIATRLMLGYSPFIVRKLKLVKWALLSENNCSFIDVLRY